MIHNSLRLSLGSVLGVVGKGIFFFFHIISFYGAEIFFITDVLLLYNKTRNFIAFKNKNNK